MPTIPIAAAFGAALFVTAVPCQAGKKAAPAAENLVRNGGFEEGAAAGVPNGWFHPKGPFAASCPAWATAIKRRHLPAVQRRLGRRRLVCESRTRIRVSPRRGLACDAADTTLQGRKEVCA